MVGLYSSVPVNWLYLYTVEVNMISQFGKIDFWQLGSCSYPASVLCNLNEDGGSVTLSDFATQPLTGLRIAYGV